MAKALRACGITSRSRFCRLAIFTAMVAIGPAHATLIIAPTLDSTITSNVNSAALQGAINNSINIFQSLFNDNITVNILFRYSTTAPNGIPLSGGTLAQSNFVIYNNISWNTYKNALVADGKTANDALANASLPLGALSTNIIPSSADGRAIGLNTPPAMFADSTVGVGGPYDGIVTLNSSQPFQFNRPTGGSNFDAQRAIQHEIDEILGLGSYLNLGGQNLRPQDLFTWSAPGTRNLTTGGSRYLSIDGGVTNIVSLNQNGGGDFGDWLSASCPQADPFVQNAFSCPGQFTDVSAASPEGINLDVIGYDLAAVTVPEPGSIIFVVSGIGLLLASRRRNRARLS